MLSIAGVSKHKGLDFEYSQWHKQLGNTLLRIGRSVKLKADHVAPHGILGAGSKGIVLASAGKSILYSTDVEGVGEVRLRMLAQDVVAV